MDFRSEQEVGGICSATIIQAYFAKSIQRVSDIFAFMTENAPRHFFRHPPGEPSPGLAVMPPVYSDLCPGMGGGDVWNIPYTSPARHPLFFRYPLVYPLPPW